MPRGSRTVLNGQTVVVTRAARQNLSLIKSLRSLGAKVIPCPAIDIISRRKGKDIAGMVKTIKKNPTAFDWILFLSENGVRHFIQLIRHHRLKFPIAQICAVGPKTAQFLKERKIEVSLMASTFNEKGVLAALPRLKGKSILIPRVFERNNWLAKALKKDGARVLEVGVYQTVPAQRPEERKKARILKNSTSVIFTSPFTVVNFLKYFNGRERRELFSRAAAYSIGPSTTITLKRKGIKRLFQAKNATTENLIQLLIKKGRS